MKHVQQQLLILTVAITVLRPCSKSSELAKLANFGKELELQTINQQLDAMEAKAQHVTELKKP